MSGRFYIDDEHICDSSNILSSFWIETYPQAKEICDFLNQQNNIITDLTEQNNRFKAWESLYDLDTLSSKFYVDTHWIKNKHTPHPIANVFSNHDAMVLCGLLNDLLPYKLLVRKHKMDLESIYGKPLKEQLKEVIKE